MMMSNSRCKNMWNYETERVNQDKGTEVLWFFLSPLPNCCHGNGQISVNRSIYKRHLGNETNPGCTHFLCYSHHKEKNMYQNFHEINVWKSLETEVTLSCIKIFIKVYLFFIKQRQERQGQDLIQLLSVCLA